MKIFLILVITALIACDLSNENAQEIIKVTKFSNNVKEEYTLNQNGEVDGFYKLYYPNGMLLQYNEMKGGMKNGFSKEYYPSGKIFRILDLKENLLNGCEVQFFENGNLMGVRNFKNDTVVGKVQTFYSNGFIKSIYHAKDNHYIGHVYEYYDNGFLNFYKLFDSKGVLSFWCEYDIDGQVLEEKGSPVLIKIKESIIYEDSVVYPVALQFVRPPNYDIEAKVFQLNSENKTLTSMEYKNVDTVTYYMNKANGNNLKILTYIENKNGKYEYVSSVEINN